MKPDHEAQFSPRKLICLTAVFPASHEDRRGHFIANMHRDLFPDFNSEVLAPRISKQDLADDQWHSMPVFRFDFPGGSLVKQRKMGLRAILAYLKSASRMAIRCWMPKAEIDSSQQTEVAPIVLAHWILPMGWVGLKLSKSLKAPLVLYAHGSDLNRFGLGLWKRPFLRKIIKQASLILVVSEELAERVRTIDASAAGKIRHLAVGIDSDFVFPDPARTQPGVTRLQQPFQGELRTPLKLLFVGDLIPSKGFDKLAKAVTELRSQGLNIELRVAGNGPLADLCAADGIRAEPMLTPAELCKIMHESHYLVLPSASEGCPLVVQEAIACALPVLSTAVGDIAKLFEDRKGWRKLNANNIQADLIQKIRDLYHAGTVSNENEGHEMLKNDCSQLYRSARVQQLKKYLKELPL